VDLRGVAPLRHVPRDPAPRPTGRAGPSAAAREGNAAGIAPHRPLPIWGHLLAAGKCGAGCRGVCHHRSPPGWRASTGASLGGRLPRSPPRSPPPPPHCHDGQGSAARGRDGATRGLRRGPTPRAATWGCCRVFWFYAVLPYAQLTLRPPPDTLRQGYALETCRSSTEPPTLPLS